jgi:glycosyltransferase involved in cell wall biosynthesis
MKILLLTQWYPPEPQKFRSDLSETLQALGHKVTVLTGFPNYPSGNLYPGYRLRLWQRETIRGVSVIRIPLYPNHSTSSWKRSLNYLSFTAAASLLGPCVIPRPDIVYVFSPPLTLACPGWLLSRFFRVPLTCEIQDMWPETLAATGMLRSRRILGWMGRVGDWFYRRCQAIRVISPGFRDNLLGKGVAAGKIHFIPNWVDTEFYYPRKYNNDLAEELQLKDRFNVMYAGTIGRAQGLEVTLDAAHLLRDLPDVQFVLIGDGTDLAALQQTARERGLTNVKFLGRYPDSMMGRFFSAADALLIHLRDEPLFRITIPHKIYTYMAVGKPILAAVGGNAAATVAAARAGLTCPPANAEALAAAVRSLRNSSPRERNAMGQNGRRTACEIFHREAQVRRISEMLEGVVSRTNKE